MWRSFPPDILIKTILVPGGAFRMAYAFRDGEPEKYRYFFVLNKSPESSEVILVSTATTQVEKRKRARGARRAGIHRAIRLSSHGEGFCH